MYMNNSKTIKHSCKEVINGTPARKDDYCADLSYMAEDELQQLAIWNATRRDYPLDKCVPQLFAMQATAQPHALALVADDQELCYGELNRRANQLAHYLQSLGVKPNVRVGLCIGRSLDMVVGLLGILKAGGVYVPLDPSYPPERLAFMIEDARAPVLVTLQHIATRLSCPVARIICLDTDAPVLSRQSATDPISAATINDLVYVIYTSGSTGRPKGVQITHKSLLNLIFWHQRAFTVTSSSRATQLTSPAFDATGWELWPYLTMGACVYLASDSTRVEPIALRDWLVNKGVTITFIPTTLAESIMVLEWPSTTRLRYLLTGADRLHHYPPSSLPFKVINNYGPTEATVLVTSGQVPALEHPDMPPSIGRAIDNTQIYILDEQLRQVPIGEAGELHIGGISLATGYLNLPEQTAEKFIAHPFSQEPGARLYKTGDLARYLPDGQIAFMGRVDQQIKIRGFRIEPGEIVSVLNKHPAIENSVVIAREDIPDDKRLVAYLMLVEGERVTAGALRDTILEFLPDYMLPSAFVVLDSLPLTPNGKVDRAALPAPDATNTLHDDIVALPSNPIEERLAGIVCTLLAVEQIGIDDNFFLLGGHSMLGTQLIMRIAHTFGVNLPLRALFEAPTTRELSTQIEQRILAKVGAMSDEEVQQLLR
jgi:amino acid adenylation domain-containing protein